MVGSALYLVPPSRFANLVPDIDAFDEEFDNHNVERLDFGYWELFAHEIAAVSVVGTVLFTGEAEGWFIFEWSPAFVSALLVASPESVRQVVQVLLPENSSAGMSESKVSSPSARSYRASSPRRSRRPRLS